MSISDRLTRIPRPFDAEDGAEGAALLPSQSGPVKDLLIGTAGSSPYLLGLLRKEAQWLEDALNDPDAMWDAELARLKSLPAKEVATGLRQGKRRVALLTALMDLGGVWSLEQVTGALSDFADLACDLALKAALWPLIARGKLPGMTQDDVSDCAGMVILAMGKMGAGELNYSSDIDLICLFDQDRFDPADFDDARATFIKATRQMVRLLSDVTGDGYVFRTDLRLRPDPSVTPVCLSMGAAERYYESLGRTWERAAYIKARACAGDLEAGTRFLSGLTPFVWRKHLDFTAIEDAHNMRLAIREHKGLGGPITLPGHNMKLGRGGIREIEFFTQTRQLIAGGRDPSLRLRGTVPGLQALADADWITQDTAASLTDHYRFHRTVEHRIQMVRDAQTHDLPQNEAGFDRLACLMAMDRPALEQEVHDRLSVVHGTTEGFFAPTEAEQAVTGPALLENDVITRWSSYPALRTDRARASLERLLPTLEARLAEAARPDDALNALDGFLSGLPAGVQVFALFEANPQLIDLVLDVAATSPALAEHLSRNAQVLDAVIGGDFFSEWKGQAALEADLDHALSRHQNDYEGTLDATRRWMKEWHFRIGVHVLRGLSSATEAGTQYADLARAVLHNLWPRVQAEFARRHGIAPGRGAILLGMGALGAGLMNARSDLDLIVIYDADGDDMSAGPRPLAVRPYFARLTQALITAISAPMSEGRLYEVDMRLRPSGNQGPVATNFAGFREYQQCDAWTWEHLALSRAQVIAGPDDLAQDVETFRCELLAMKRDPKQIAGDVIEMRNRIAAAKPSAGWLDIKAGGGRMQDIELLAQMGLVLFGLPTRDVASGLNALVAAQVLAQAAATDLADQHALLWHVQLAGRLLSPALHTADALGPSGREALLRITGQTSLESLQETLHVGQTRAADAIDAVLTRICEDGVET
ncbi:MAG: glutamine-synthetase adenylyltransferase [Aliishimia sp.]